MMKTLIMISVTNIRQTHFSLSKSVALLLVRVVVDLKPIPGKLGVMLGIHSGWNGSPGQGIIHTDIHSFII